MSQAIGRPIAVRFEECPSVPRLAWCAVYEADSRILTVYHGSWVETGQERFFEGAWNGDLAGDGFCDAFMTGTGGRIARDSITFVAPSHTLDRLNVIRKARTTIVSNSFPFILAMAGEELDDDFLFYDSLWASIRRGLGRYERSLRMNGGGEVSLYYCCNLTLTQAGEVIETPKPRSPAMQSYRDYHAILSSVVRKVSENAADSRRKVRYAPIATVSRGYDSPAAMVLATAGGCSEAMAFRDSRDTEGDADCGTLIARELGLTVTEFGRFDYLQQPGFPEIRNSGGPSEFLSFGDALAGRLLFTGFNGDMVWDKNCSKISTTLVRSDASGASLTEFRLASGFCHLPVPFIAADRLPEIHAISNSAEMRAWSVHSSYDRPIARRIVEDAGIPRSYFGQKKRAAGVVVSAEGLKATMSDRSIEDFLRFQRSRWNAAKTARVRLLRLVKRFTQYNDRAERIGRRLARETGIRFLRVPQVFSGRLGMLAFGYVGRESMLFHWGTEKLVALYRAAVERHVGSQGPIR
jgi:hypothetical protein